MNLELLDVAIIGLLGFFYTCAICICIDTNSRRIIEAIHETRKPPQ